MTRKKEPEIDISLECEEAYDRLVALADQLAAMLTGDPLSDKTGQVTTPRAHALVMGMIYFMLRADPRDLHTVFFTERSLAQFERGPLKPLPEGHEAPLAKFLDLSKPGRRDGEAVLSSVLAGA